MSFSRALARSFHPCTKHSPEKRREMVSGMRSAGMSNRAIAKELGVDEATIRNDLKALAMPAGERKKPGRPREWRPRYDPSDPESRDKYKAAAMTALLRWFRDQGVSRPYLQQVLDIVPRRNYFERIDSLSPGLPVRRFDELFELTRPKLQPHDNDQWIELIILWCRRWLFAALPDSEMRNLALHRMQVQLDLGSIG